jgi:hypothetical protein
MELLWKKSSRSSGNGQSLAWAFDGETIYVRDTKQDAGPMLEFTVDEWEAFLYGVKNGEADI